MLSCIKGRPCDAKADKNEPGGCGSNIAYAYFVSFIFFCSFLMLNLFVAVIMDNFDYLTRDSSILGAHHLDEFVRIWAEYDPNATGKIHYTEMYDMLKNMDPPLGFGNKCPNRLAFKKLIRMNMPVDGDGKVNFTTTLFALIRENLSIKMRCADEMNQANEELRDTIRSIWPLQAKKMLDLLIPRNEELNRDKLTVGKIYVCLLILESWRSKSKPAEQQSAFFNCLLDISAVNHIGNNHGAGSRANSLEPVIRPATDVKLDRQTDHRDEEEGALGVLAAAAHRRQRSIRNKKVNWKMSRQYDILGSSGESSQGGGGSGVVLVVNGEDRAPELEPLLAEVSSQRDDQNNYYHHHHDQYYYDTDNDQYYDHHQYYHHHHHHHDHHDHRPPSYYQHQNTYVPRSSIRYHKVYPVLVARRGQGRRLPPTPNKPSTLQLKPANINFPKLNASPTHGLHGPMAPGGPTHVPVASVPGHVLQHPHPPTHMPPASMQPSHHPLSFEQAVAMGRGGRLLPSPVPNGYKPQPQSKQRTPR
ncbi:voltage-dependent calcium channel type a subunit alpha-1 [Lasius niger]|uniref:Voltage-dependent calcium channel type a subunit alpha-1 n=1 Tax=Lasius niger TaxID=67767 RepID=A0A0J7KW27_LASNI|nr:voltage-dependent calcium channel type a subunit alpha-1 [Lasius niger]